METSFISVLFSFSESGDRLKTYAAVAAAAVTKNAAVADAPTAT